MREARAEIYTITHVASGKHYVGSSVDARRRFVQHKNALNKGTHTSRRLQIAWTKNGPDAFDFQVIEVCTEEDRAIREQFHIDDQKPYFNWARVLPASLDPRVRKQISEAMRGNQNTKGLVWSDESRANMSRAVKGKPRTPAQIEATRRALALGRQNSRANKPGWIPTHRIGVKDSPETIAKRRASRLRFEAEKRGRSDADAVSEAGSV
jgi:group I intron endonuclease